MLCPGSGEKKLPTGAEGVGVKPNLSCLQLKAAYGQTWRACPAGGHPNGLWTGHMSNILHKNRIKKGYDEMSASTERPYYSQPPGGGGGNRNIMSKGNKMSYFFNQS